MAWAPARLVLGVGVHREGPGPVAVVAVLPAGADARRVSSWVVVGSCTAIELTVAIAALVLKVGQVLLRQAEALGDRRSPLLVR